MSVKEKKDGINKKVLEEKKIGKRENADELRELINNALIIYGMRKEEVSIPQKNQGFRRFALIVYDLTRKEMEKEIKRLTKLYHESVDKNRGQYRDGLEDGKQQERSTLKDKIETMLKKMVVYIQVDKQGRVWIGKKKEEPYSERLLEYVDVKEELKNILEAK